MRRKSGSEAVEVSVRAQTDSVVSGDVIGRGSDEREEDGEALVEDLEGFNECCELRERGL